MAAIAFPLFFLPLAAWLAGKRGKVAGATIWVALWAGTVAAGALFAALAPDLTAPTGEAAAYRTRAAMLAAVISLAVFVIGPRTLALRLARPFSAITTLAGRTVMWLILAMALVQFVLVILRYVFGLNSIFAQESITYMHGAVFLLAAGTALLTDDHVRVDILYRDAPPKRRALVDLLGAYLLLLPLCVLIVWTSGAYVADSWAVREGSTEQSGIQGVFLLKSLTPAFAVLLLMAGFVAATRASEVLLDDSVT